MVPVTTAANPAAARIVAAHLGAEGIVWQLRALHGDVDGPYPVGPVVVMVPADDLEVARALVGAPSGGAEARPARRHIAGGSRDGAARRSSRRAGDLRRRAWVVAVGLVLLVVLAARLLLGL